MGMWLENLSESGWWGETGGGPPWMRLQKKSLGPWGQLRFDRDYYTKATQKFRKKFQVPQYAMY